MNKRCSDCFRALGVGTRIKIYDFIEKEGEVSVSSVVDFIKLKQPTVTYHLKELYGLGLLERKTRGKGVFYKINKRCPYGSRNCVLHAEHVEN